VELPNFPELSGYRWELKERGDGNLKLVLSNQDCDWMSVDMGGFSAAGDLCEPMSGSIPVEIVRTLLDVWEKIPVRSLAAARVVLAHRLCEEMKYPNQHGAFGRGFQDTMVPVIQLLRQEISDLDDTPSSENVAEWRSYLGIVRQRILDREQQQLREAFG
jgi:hypothetical protein